MDITAAVVRKKSTPFVLEQLLLDDPRDNEVVVRLTATGICHTDLIVRDQYYPVPLPAVLGHEGAGIVERVGRRVTRVAKGDAVVMSFGWCGHCPRCLDGSPAYCDHMWPHNFGGKRPGDGSPTLHDATGAPVGGYFFSQSSFATHALGTETSVVPVPREAPLDYLGPLGCGLQTGAGAILNTLRPRAGDSVAVFGAGSVGLAGIMAAAIAGCGPVIAADINPARLELALALGATHAVDPGGTDPVAEIRRATGGGAACALETTGIPSVLRQAVDALCNRGVVGVIGAPPMGTEASFDVNDVLAHGKSIRGVVQGDSVSRRFIPVLAGLFAAGRFPIDRLVRFYDFRDINRAAADSEAGITIKPVLRFP